MKKSFPPSIASLQTLPHGSEVQATGKITEVSVKRTKNGDTMAFVLLEDETGIIEIMIFPDVYAQFAIIDPGRSITVLGKINEALTGNNMIAYEISQCN